MGFAQDLAARALSISPEQSPPEAVHVARRAFADTLGVALAGADAPYLGALGAVLDAGKGPEHATLWGQRQQKVSVVHAALINATAAHALDFDDCSVTMGGHPSVPVVPVVLALAEAESISAGQAIEAYLTGFEVETRLARGLLPAHYEKGWHPTATLGVFGAAAAAGRMLGFDTEQMANALAMATSLSSGLKANFGTPLKPIQVGQSASNGLLAAFLTRRGIKANLDAFEHTYGYFNLYNGAGAFDAEAILDGWDEGMEILSPGISIKQHPCCGSAHSAIDAALKIVAREGLISPGNISSVETRTHERRLAHTNRANPTSGLSAKFSVQFLTAKALIDGRIGLRDFSDDAFLTPEIATVLPRVTALAHSEDDAYLGHVRVTLADGRVLEDKASTNFGRGPDNPMSDDELRDKFVDCAGTLLGQNEAIALFNRILGLELSESLAPVLAASVRPER